MFLIVCLVLHIYLLSFIHYSESLLCCCELLKIKELLGVYVFFSLPIINPSK